MSGPCGDCNRLQPSCSSHGNASLRPPFNQPTMYDHLSSFSKFNQEKMLSKQLKSKEEELLKFNPKFTNLEIDKKPDEILEKFSTQDIAKFRYNLKESRLHRPPVKTDREELWKEQPHEVKATSSFTTILRTPVSCPVSKCGRIIGVTSVLSHFLRDHNEDLMVECVNLYAGGRSILLFDRDMFEFGQNVCLGVLSYGGIEKQAESQPALRGICKQNSFLSKPFTHLENHLPILVMVCKTSICAILGDKKLYQEFMNPADTKKQVLVIWLATVQTTIPVLCTLTAFDKSMTSSRSTIINVRSLDSPQRPEDFLSSETNYLMLNNGELNILSEDGKESIRMEIKIQEFH